MNKVNTNELRDRPRRSPKRKYAASIKEISTALGRDDSSTDLLKRHPFDVCIATIPPGKTLCPLHAHSAQWEFYHIISGTGIVREIDEETEVTAGDAFIFKPGEAHQIRNDSAADLVYYVIADNPLNEHCYYPDSDKWIVSTPERRLIRSEPLDYFDGEE